MNAPTEIPRLPVRFSSSEQLVEEYSKRLCKGVVIAQGGIPLTVGDPCEAVLVHPGTGHLLPLKVRVTSTNLAPRVLCQLEEFNPEVDEVIRNFVNLQPDVAPNEDVTPGLSEEVTTADGDLYVVEDGSGDVWEEDINDTHPNREGERDKLPANVHERLRRLPIHEIYKVARTGHLAERVALERIYGKTVWEALLQNPNLTPPEVARISRMGTLPKPLIDTIVSHAGWMTKPLIRRALLTNPRLDGRALMKVLRALPKNELTMVPQQSAYPYKIREAAKRLLGK